MDRMEEEEDLVAATTEEAQQSEEDVEVEEAEEMVVTTQLDMIIAVETITMPKNRSNVETKRIHWISFMSCELLKTTIQCSSSAPTKTTVILAFTRAPSTTFSKRPVS